MTADLSPAATPRPVPSPEARMRDARTDTTGRTFATYLDRTERDQLDAKAATAEQERDEALDDRDAYREARDVLRTQLDAMKAAKKRVLGRLEKAEHVIDLIRDRQEQIDRALAVYDTTPGEGGVTITLDNSAGTFTPRHPGDALADALRNAYTTEHLAGLVEAGGDSPREDPLGRLVDALFAARWQTQQPALGSPPPRAQEPIYGAASLLRQAAAGRREYAKNIPEKAEPLDLQAHTLDAAAQVVEGDLAPLYDWLPSWRWTPEMHARLHPEREG